MLTKVTLDHNCIIDLVNQTEIGKKVESIIHNKLYQCFVVNIGASERNGKALPPIKYENFEELLCVAGIAHLPRLNPILMWGLTFWGISDWGGEDDVKLTNAIRDVLFGKSTSIEITPVDQDSPAVKNKWVNQECDVHGMWCHIQYGNEVFLTTDRNFTKATKLPKLLALGAKRICSPSEL